MAGIILYNIVNSFQRFALKEVIFESSIKQLKAQKSLETLHSEECSKLLLVSCFILVLLQYYIYCY